MCRETSIKSLVCKDARYAQIFRKGICESLKVWAELGKKIKDFANILAEKASCRNNQEGAIDVVSSH